MAVLRDDLALARDPAHRFLPILLAIMVYLAILALAGMIVLGAAVTRWDQGLTGTATVELPPLAAGEAERADGKASDRQTEEAAQAGETDEALARAVDTLSAMPGILAVRPLPREETAALIRPWLGDEAINPALPLPRLIDVTIRTDAPPDMEGLASLLADAVPGAVLHDHRAALDRLLRLARTVEFVALLIVLLVAGAAIATVIFITRTGLAIHYNAIELLHMIGASDSYVARQFQGQALVLGLKGGVIGLGIGLATLAVLGHFARHLQGGLLPDLQLDPVHGAMIVAVPLALTLIAMITARLTVLAALRRMP